MIVYNSEHVSQLTPIHSFTSLHISLYPCMYNNNNVDYNNFNVQYNKIELLIL